MRSAALVALVLAAAAAAGCGHADRAPIPPPIKGEAPPPTGRAPDLPPGWIAIDPPDAARLRCANYSDDEWQVAVDGDQLHVTAATPHEPDTGPTVAFMPDTIPAGRRHALAVADGFLVGYDAGEWGGALYWISADGTTHTEIAKENVRGVLAVGDDAAVAFEGLAHMGINEGAVRWLKRAPNGWTTDTVGKLDGQPQAIVAAPDAMYVVTFESLVRIRTDRTIETIQKVTTEGLYPDSMAVDATGQLWIGMRQFVLRLTPAGGTYTPQWFVEARCKTVTQVDLSCRCTN